MYVQKSILKGLNGLGLQLSINELINAFCKKPKIRLCTRRDTLEMKQSPRHESFALHVIMLIVIHL